MDSEKLDTDKEDEDEKESRICFTYFLLTERKKGLGAGREISLVINNIQQAAKNISRLVQSYGIFKGMQTGELSIKSFEQKNLLRTCESIFLKSLTSSIYVCLIGSSYSNELIEINNGEHGKFVVTFVPLEGDLSLNYKLVCGSIFSIYKKLNRESISKEDFMQNGNAIISAGYILYGNTTVFVFSPAPGTGLHEFVLDPDINEFILINSKIEMPTHGVLYTMNEGRLRSMETCVFESVNRKKNLCISRGRIPKCRYSGSIIADTHCVIKEGGLLIAPSYIDFQNGMVKQQFIGNPLSFLVNEAGGAASNGNSPLIDVSVDDPHQFMPVYLGSIKEHQEFMRILAGMNKLSRLFI